MPEKQILNEVDPMIWFHLAKLKNLSALLPAQEGKQAARSVERVIAMLSGDAGSDEPESPAILARIAEVIRA